MTVYIAYNCAGPGATTQTNVATNGVAYTTTGSRMMQQITCPSTDGMRIIEWGVSCSGSAAGTPNTIELAVVGTGTTVSTAYTTSTILPLDDPNAPVTSMTVATSGYYTGAVTRTSTTVSRVLDVQLVAPTNQFIHQWPLGREPCLSNAIVQLTMNLATACTIVSYLCWEEY